MGCGDGRAQRNWRNLAPCLSAANFRGVRKMTCCPVPVGLDSELPRLEAEEAKRWLSFAGPGLSRIELIVPGVHCAACMGTIERALKAMAGVVSARVNLTARRVAITWRDSEAEPQAFIECLARLGYPARPFDPRETGFLQDDREGKALLRALAVAGFAASNVMLLSVSVWSGADAATRDLFHWISALIALPAVVYAGRPFFSSAVGALRPGMTMVVAAGERFAADGKIAEGASDIDRSLMTGETAPEPVAPGSSVQA